MLYTSGAAAQVTIGKSPAAQPYPYINPGGFSGSPVRESPDPLINYRWTNPKASDGLEVFLLPVRLVSADHLASFKNLESATAKPTNIQVLGTGSIRMDFGVEAGAWIEFDSPDCLGGIEMSISEYNEPGVEKTAVPIKHGNTWRLELNPELYDGVRFAWIHVRDWSAPWHITGIRAVVQVKPTNYNGSFTCSNPVLTQAWYVSAYSVKASLCKDYFGAILMERGDRMSWTGDAHTSQAAALAAFGNFDFIRQNIDNTSEQSNGIRSYSLYWVLSLLDYYWYTGDSVTLNKYIKNACKKLDDANKVFGTNPGLRFYGWDERLCAGFEIWFRECPEAQMAYKMLSVRAWKDFSVAMGFLGRKDLKEKYEKLAADKMTELRQDPDWYKAYGLHAAADAINTGLLNQNESNELYQKWFTDRVARLSISPFNQYFIIQAMARVNQRDDALSSVNDMWGGMAAYGGTTTFETYRPSWNQVVGKNDPVPNTQSGITSLCHPWGAGVVKWLNEEIAGIIPTSPGFKTYDILPHPGRTLIRINGSTPTPFGTISASFDVKSGKGLISAPSGTIGRIGIPKAEKQIVKIMINGKLCWDGRFHPVAGIDGAAEDQEFVYLTGLKPGTWSISIKYKGKTPGYIESPEVYAGKYIRIDAETSGSWGGTYGRDGYILCNYQGDGKDLRSLPDYVTSVDYYRAFPNSGTPDATLWAKETKDQRAPASDLSNRFPRTAAGYTNSDQTMTATVGIRGMRPYRIALYFVDWENTGSRMAVEMFDAESLNLVAPVKVVKDYTGGCYLIFSYNKSVKFRIDKIRGGNISLSGFFFDSLSF